MAYAELRGLGVVLHDQPLGIGSAMTIHLAAARLPWLGHDTELFGHVMLEDDLILQEIDYQGGKARLPKGPGWGVDLDEAALEKYAVGETLKITAG
jgi:muconate cycloisomerase